MTQSGNTLVFPNTIEIDIWLISFLFSKRMLINQVLWNALKPPCELSPNFPPYFHRHESIISKNLLENINIKILFNIEHFFFMFMFIEVATPNLFGVISTSWENPSLFFKSSLISIFTLPKILWELLSLSESLSSFFYPGTKSFDILLFWWITFPSTWAISIKSNFEPRECIFGSGMSKEAPFRQDFLLDMVLKPDFLVEGAGLFGSVSSMISSRGLTWLLLLRNWTSLRFPGILLSDEAITFPSIFFSIDKSLLYRPIYLSFLASTVS